MLIRTVKFVTYTLKLYLFKWNKWCCTDLLLTISLLSVTFVLFFSHLFVFYLCLRCFSHSRTCGVVLSMLPLWARVGLRKLVVSEHICKNNKVTKHELFNLQLLFTLVIFLAWGLRHILQEAGELLGYLLWDLTLNLSQACFNWNVLGLFRHISAFAIMSSNPFI